MSTSQTEVHDLEGRIDLEENDIWLRDTPSELIPKMGEWAVSSAAYYQQLIITEAAGSGGGTGPLDKRISPFATDEVPVMDRPSVGVLLTFEQGWFQEGLALGELRKSLCLAPGEVTKVAMVDWRRKTSSVDQSATSQSEALAAQTADASAAVTVQKSMLEETRSSSSFVMGSSSHHQTGGSGGIPLFFSASGSTSTNSFMGFSATSSAGERSVGAEASKNIQRRTQQLSQSARAARATQIREVSEEESQTTTTRVVANYNHAHALTMQYYEVLQIYSLKTRAIRADRCIFVPIKPLAFNEQSMIATNDATLERLRQVLQEFGAAELDEMVAEFQRKLPAFKELRKLASEAVNLRARVGVASRRKIEAPRVWAIETEQADGRRALIHSTRSADVAPFAIDDIASLAQRISGTYENFPQNPDTKNDWHYTSVEVVDEATLRWTNRSGASWTLSLTDDENVLNVGTDCPYYSNGYTTARVAFDVYGNVKHIVGPGNSPYLNEENRTSRLAGIYENFPHNTSLKNDWHYVELSANGGNTLRWTNRAGASWTLMLTGDDNVLAVGTDCPYYASGYTSARVGFDLLGNVTHIVGPGNSPYVNEKTSKLVPPQWSEKTVTVVPTPMAMTDQIEDVGLPLIDQEGAWRRDTADVTTYLSQGPSRGRIWDQWSWYMVDTRSPGAEPTAVTDADLVQADMWRGRISYGNGDTDGTIVAQFQSEQDHSAWVVDTLRLAQVERRYEADRRELDAFGRLFGLLDDVGLFLNQQMWMRTDDYTWRGLLSGRVFPHGEYEGQDIGGMVNPTPVGFFGNYLAFMWDFPQDRPGESKYRDQATAFDEVFIGSEEVAAAKTKNEATIALPTEGIFAEAVLGQSNSAEKIDMTRFWNWQESPIPILPPGMAAVNTDTRARNQAVPDRLRLGEALVALRTAGVDKALLGDEAILKILGESLDKGDSAAVLANAVTASIAASDNAAAGAGSAGQASVDVSKQMQDFVVDMANSEAAKIATDAALAYATGGASKMGGLLNKASKGAGGARMKSGGAKSTGSTRTGSSITSKRKAGGDVTTASGTSGTSGLSEGTDGSKDGADPEPGGGAEESGGHSGETIGSKPSDKNKPANTRTNNVDKPSGKQAEVPSGIAAATYELKWNHYIVHSTRSNAEIKSVEEQLALFVSACSYFDNHIDKLAPMRNGELNAESQQMVEVVGRAIDSHEKLTLLMEKFKRADRKLARGEPDKIKKQAIKSQLQLNQKEDQQLLANLGDVLFDLRILVAESVVSV